MSPDRYTILTIGIMLAGVYAGVSKDYSPLGTVIGILLLNILNQLMMR